MKTKYNMLAIFSGPSDAQAKEADKKADIEAEYMRWLYAEGKGSDLATCETKYAEINLTQTHNHAAPACKSRHLKT